MLRPGPGGIPVNAAKEVFVPHAQTQPIYHQVDMQPITERCYVVQSMRKLAMATSYAQKSPAVVDRL